MSKLIDLTGNKYGLLTVKSFSHPGHNSNWRCLCECGNMITTTAINLKTGNTRHCGSYIHKQPTFDDISGIVYNKLVPIRILRKQGVTQIRTYWECLCECGKTTVVESGNLKSGHTKSCGCHLKEQITTHGCCAKNRRLYGIWRGMHERCYDVKNKGYRWYGDKGIYVCEEWHSIAKFFDWALANGYKYPLTLERKNVYKIYSPDNCTWIPREKQPHNTTVSTGIKNVRAIRKLLAEGHTPKELATKYKVAYTTIIAIKNRDNYKDLK